MKTQAKKTETQGKRAKRPGEGRPPTFKSPQEFLDKAKQYLANCEERRSMPNVAGFCVFVGTHRDTFYEYKNKKEYSDSIKRLMSSIENAWVNRLSGQAATGAIFYLKNAFREDYKDRVETDITSKGESIQIYVPERK